MVSLAAKRPKGSRSSCYCQIFARTGQGGPFDRGSAPTRDNGKVNSDRPLERGSRLRDLQPTSLLFGFFFLFQRFSLVRHHSPTASQIEVRSSKDVIGYLSSVMPALIGPLSAFVSTVQHHGGSPPGRL